MKRALCTIILFVAFAATISAGNAWTVAERAVRAASAPVQYMDGTNLRTVCTSWSINEQNRLFATAAHCYDEKAQPFIDGQLAWLTFLNEHKDVAVFQVLGTNRKALKPRTSEVERAMAIAAYGFAFGFPAQFREGVIAHPSLEANFHNLPKYNGRTWVAASFAYIGGMSGGPVVDEDGRVVSMVQLGGDGTGFGIPVAELRSLIGQFWR